MTSHILDEASPIPGARWTILVRGPGGGLMLHRDSVKHYKVIEKSLILQTEDGVTEIFFLRPGDHVRITLCSTCGARSADTIKDIQDS